jgi:outer membrane protein TolC
MKLPRTWIVAFTFAPLAALAQHGGRVELSLPAALDRAKSVAPKLRQLRALESAARFSTEIAQGSRWPSVNATAGYTRTSDVPELAVNLGTGPVTIFPNIPNNYRTRIEAALPLFTGGKLSGLVAAAKSQERAVQSDVATGNADLTLETTVGYWLLVTTGETETVLKAALASYDAHLKDTENRQANGLAARNEVLAVQVERDQSELSLIQARNTLQISHANLLRLLDYPPETRIQPTESLDAMSSSASSTEQSVARALRARPDRAALSARLAAAEEVVRVARSTWWPSLAATGGYDYSRPNKRILPTEDNFQGTWDVGVALSMNLFEGGRTAAAVDQARAQAEAIRQALADLDQRIRLDVTSRLLDLESAQAAIPVAIRGVDAGTENLKVSQNRYRAGVIPSSELLDAETALLRAALRKVEVLARLQIARAQLARAVGE